MENFINREENQKITIAEVEAILRNEEEYFDKDFKAIDQKGKKGVLKYDKNGKIVKKKFDKRAHSSKIIKRFNEKDMDKPLNRNEEAYLKKYMNYMVKKKTKKIKEEDNIYLNEKEKDDWNKTEILSKNFQGGVDRKDNLSGHLYNEDYSFYYLSINSENTPKSLSLKSFNGNNSRSRSRGKKISVTRKINKKHLKNATQNIRYSLSRL